MIKTEQSVVSHVPVLLKESVSLLHAENGGTFLDCTFGGGGHTRAILDANEKNFVYAIDRDPEAKLRARELSKIRGNFVFYQSNFSDIQFLKTRPLNGILMDLGVSSFQLESDDRGFSFRSHSLMDMRMDNTSGMPAYEFLRTASECDLVTAIRDYGEEGNWKAVVNMIVENRKNTHLQYSDTFAKMVCGVIPREKHQKIHPATKTFQGIRIFVNDELASLERALPMLFDRLMVGGRLVVISFHSLEDGIVKKFFNKVAGHAVDRFDSLSQQDRVPVANILTKKPISPTDFEISQNIRSRSAKLRAVEKIKEENARQ